MTLLHSLRARAHGSFRARDHRLRRWFRLVNLFPLVDCLFLLISGRYSRLRVVGSDAVVEEALGKRLVKVQDDVCEVSNRQLASSDRSLSQPFRRLDERLSDSLNEGGVAIDVLLGFLTFSELVHDHDCLQGEPVRPRLQHCLVADVQQPQLLVQPTADLVRLR